jgi:hypothetical protein
MSASAKLRRHASALDDSVLGPPSGDLKGGEEGPPIFVELRGVPLRIDSGAPAGGALAFTWNGDRPMVGKMMAREPGSGVDPWTRSCVRPSNESAASAALPVSDLLSALTECTSLVMDVARVVADYSVFVEWICRGPMISVQQPAGHETPYAAGPTVPPSMRLLSFSMQIRWCDQGTDRPTSRHAGSLSHRSPTGIACRLTRSWLCWVVLACVWLKGWGNRKGRLFCRVMRPVKQLSATPTVNANATATAAAAPAALSANASASASATASASASAAVAPLPAAAADQKGGGATPVAKSSAVATGAGAPLCEQPAAVRWVNSVDGDPAHWVTVAQWEPFGIAEHHWQEARAELPADSPLFAVVRTGDLFEFWKDIGGGGGHQLKVAAFAARLSFGVTHSQSAAAAGGAVAGAAAGAGASEHAATGPLLLPPGRVTVLREDKK